MRDHEALINLAMKAENDGTTIPLTGATETVREIAIVAKIKVESITIGLTHPLLGILTTQTRINQTRVGNITVTTVTVSHALHLPKVQSPKQKNKSVWSVWPKPEFSPLTNWLRMSSNNRNSTNHFGKVVKPSCNKNQKKIQLQWLNRLNILF